MVKHRNARSRARSRCEGWCTRGRIEATALDASGVEGAATARSRTRRTEARLVHAASLGVGGPHSRASDDSARRLLPTAIAVTARQAGQGPRSTLRHRQPKELSMPIILWLLGVPLTVIVLLMLFHVL
jgi:hypothetical protein